MTIARRAQLRLDITPYYHCLTRCVRRAFLCGFDKLTGKNLEHRRAWIEKRIFQLSDVFCIDIAGYAIMSNHYHLVLKVDLDLAQSLSDDAVIERWRKLYKGPEVVQRYLKDELLSDEEQLLLKSTIAQWRDNLTNISRFMGALNEHIARRANKEDECKGRFWESRFKLQAILDVPALLHTLSYVDLNPVRAKMATSPEESHYTSVKRRLNKSENGLIPFARNSPSQPVGALSATATEIPICFKDYLELLDWTGRQLSRGKRGAISADAPPIMHRLGYSTEQWMKTQTPRLPWMLKAVGQVEAIKDYAAAIGQRWVWQNA